MPSETIRGRVASCCFLGTRIATARGPCSVANDWAASALLSSRGSVIARGLDRFFDPTGVQESADDGMRNEMDAHELAIYRQIAALACMLPTPPSSSALAGYSTHFNFSMEASA